MEGEVVASSLSLLGEIRHDERDMRSSRAWIVFLLTLGVFCSPGVGIAAVAPSATSTAATSSVVAVTSTAEVTEPIEMSAATEQRARTQGIYERAIVQSVETVRQGDDRHAQQMVVYRVTFRSGPFDGVTKDITSDVGSNPYRMELRPGDRIIVYMQQGETGDWQLYLDGYDRRTAVYALIVLFVLMLVLLAGWQGFKVAVSITISIGMIGYILIPLFLRGVNPVPVAIVLAGAFTLISTGFATGWNRKALVTSVGTMGGALTAFAIARVFGDWAHLSGLSTEEDRLFFDKNPMLDPRGLLFAGIIIASAGVVEDVAVSIVSGISEVRKANPRLDVRQLFLSGMIVGRDHMSALANTLVYAYVGASLSTLLLFTQYGESWVKFLNFDAIVDEIIRSLSGTIGLIFTVPITAILAAWAAKQEPFVPSGGTETKPPTSHIGHRH